MSQVGPDGSVLVEWDGFDVSAQIAHHPDGHVWYAYHSTAFNPDLWSLRVALLDRNLVRFPFHAPITIGMSVMHGERFADFSIKQDQAGTLYVIFRTLTTSSASMLNIQRIDVDTWSAWAQPVRIGPFHLLGQPSAVATQAGVELAYVSGEQMSSLTGNLNLHRISFLGSPIAQLSLPGTYMDVTDMGILPSGRYHLATFKSADGATDMEQLSWAQLQAADVQSVPISNSNGSLMTIPFGRSSLLVGGVKQGGMTACFGNCLLSGDSDYQYGVLHLDPYGSAGQARAVLYRYKNADFGLTADLILAEIAASGAVYPFLSIPINYYGWNRVVLQRVPGSSVMHLVVTRPGTYDTDLVAFDWTRKVVTSRQPVVTTQDAIQYDGGVAVVPYHLAPKGGYLFTYDRNGYPGRNDPFLETVRDIPNDQGRRLWVQWAPSRLEKNRPDKVFEYAVFRGYHAGIVAKDMPGSPLTTFEAFLSDPAHGPGDRFTAAAEDLEGYVTWEWTHTVPAISGPATSDQVRMGTILSTIADSGSGGIPLTYAKVWMRSLTMLNQVPVVEIWPSNVLWAYSVDNVPPFAPSQFKSNRSGDALRLSWSSVPVDDLSHYEIRQSGATSSSGYEMLDSTRDTIRTLSASQFTQDLIWVVAVDRNGNVSPASEKLDRQTATDLEVSDDLPATTTLLQNYPNPFNPGTVISWRLAQAGVVRVSVHDLAGREIAVLADRVMPAGAHQVTFDASDLASGVYLYRLKTADVSLTRKMLLLR